MLKFSACIATTLLLAGSLSAQTPVVHLLSAGPTYTSDDGVDGPKFPRMDMVVRLTGGDAAARSFKPQEMRLFSGNMMVGQGLSMRPFGQTGYGVKSILLVDLSGDIAGAPLEAVRASMAKFVNQARDQDVVEVLSYAKDTDIEIPFQANKDDLPGRLARVSSLEGEPLLLDAILNAIAHFDDTPPACRRLVVISNGHDDGSDHSIDDVIRAALAANVPIDSIGVTRSGPGNLDALKQLSQSTGGYYAEAQSPDELPGLIDQGIRAMRAVPVVTFGTRRLPSDGLTHNLAVRWENEHLNASVAVNTPFIQSPWAVWGWVLGGCSAAVLLLLFLYIRKRTPRRPPAGMVEWEPSIWNTSREEAARLSKYIVIEGEQPKTSDAANSTAAQNLQTPAEK
jgi:hypothetical protein